MCPREENPCLYNESYPVEYAQQQKHQQAKRESLKHARHDASKGRAFNRQDFVDELRDLQKRGIERNDDYAQAFIEAYDRKHGPKAYNCDQCGYEFSSHDKPQRCADCGHMFTNER